MRKRAIATALGITGAVMLFGVTGAQAAPKNGLTFDITCPGLGSFEIVTPPGNGAFTPAIGSNQVFIAYDVQGTVTVDGTVVDEFHDVKPAPVPASAIACTFEASFEDGDAQVVIAGTAVVVPRGPTS